MNSITHENTTYTINTIESVETNTDYKYVRHLFAKTDVEKALQNNKKLDIMSTDDIDFLCTNVMKSGNTCMENLTDDGPKKIYFDYDGYVEKITKKIAKECYVKCQSALNEFFKRIPSLNLTFNSNVAVAQRHGITSTGKSKISFRFYIVGLKTHLKTMSVLIEACPELESIFDQEVYNNNRKMGMVYCHKGGFPTDYRRLLPEDVFSNKKVQDKIKQDYVIQHVEKEWPLLVLETDTLVEQAPVPVIPRATSPTTPPQYTNEVGTEIEQLVKCLGDHRANDEGQWVKVGWCLHNIPDISKTDALRLWVEFSRRSDKFVEGECEKKWKFFRNDGFGVGSLYLWARQDNPSEYAKIISESVYSDVKQCDGTHNSIARIMFKLLGNKFVCASPDGKLWFYYDDQKWREDQNKLELKRQFSTVLMRQFEQAASKARMEAPLEDQDSDADTNCTLQNKLKAIAKIKKDLKNHTFKNHVLDECVEYFYREEFINKLDANPNLLGFNNGVFHLKEKQFVSGDPNDYVSLSTGYDYDDTKNSEFYNEVDKYFKTIHPVEEQRTYLLKTLARQLYGDTGRELFHIHCGINGSAANGKTKSWEINQYCFGDYVQTFEVAMLVNKKRKEASAPAPEYSTWKGRRFLYCTEPNSDETLNSGIMKHLTGGEQIKYRLLFANKFDNFFPQYKLHIMTNDLPKIDGTDEGVKRRIRVLPYMSHFVDKDKVNHDKHMFEADDEVIKRFQESHELRMEYVRYVLDHYDHKWDYRMTDFIRNSSKEYLDDNDNIGNFVKEYLERDRDSFVTLKELKELYKRSDGYDGKLSTLKTRLERVLGVRFQDQKKIDGVKHRGVFEGYRVLQNVEIDTDF